MQHVKEFGVYADDVTAICVYLKEHDINSVALKVPAPTSKKESGK